MVRNFDDNDEGKRVVTADGDEVGVVSGAEETRLHITPTENLSRSVRRRLGWSEDEDDYVLRKSKVDSIAGDEIHLKKNL
jgi:hypothetical protein